MKEKILIIRLGALGDLVLCMRAFAAVRAHHPDAEIAILTAPAFQGFVRMMPWFDQVLLDPRPKLTDVAVWLKLRRAVKDFAPTRVYDFQGKLRQSILYNLWGGALCGPEWSGAAPLCSHPRAWPPKQGMHYTDFLEAQLQKADVKLPDSYDLSWLDAPCDDLPLPEKFALFIPGCAPNRPYKRWPAESYAALAKKLLMKGITSLAVGTDADAESIAQIRDITPEVIDLSGKTSLPQLGGLARKAVCVFGNDTGPTHLAAAVGAKTIALMSDQVDPLWSSPKGVKTQWVQGKPISELGVDEVWNIFQN